MTHYCPFCGYFRLISALTFRCGECADRWGREHLAKEES